MQCSGSPTPETPLCAKRAAGGSLTQLSSGPRTVWWGERGIASSPYWSLSNLLPLTGGGSLSLACRLTDREACSTQQKETAGCNSWKWPNRDRQSGDGGGSGRNRDPQIGLKSSESGRRRTTICVRNLECHDGGADAGDDVGAAIGRIDCMRANKLSRSGEQRPGKLNEGSTIPKGKCMPIMLGRYLCSQINLAGKHLRISFSNTDLFLHFSLQWRRGAHCRVARCCRARSLVHVIPERCAISSVHPSAARTSPTIPWTR